MRGLQCCRVDQHVVSVGFGLDAHDLVGSATQQVVVVGEGVVVELCRGDGDRCQGWTGVGVAVVVEVEGQALCERLESVADGVEHGVVGVGVHSRLHRGLDRLAERVREPHGGHDGRVLVVQTLDRVE